MITPGGSTVTLFYRKKQKPVNAEEIFIALDETIDTLTPGARFCGRNYVLLDRGGGKIM
jgi:hypothetical protein